MTSAQVKKETTGWFVARILIVFFAVMLLANGIFVWFALTTHTGDEVKNAYEEGKNYNHTLEQARHQKQLGWHVRISQEEQIFLINISDAEDKLLENIRVEAFLFSPQSPDKDVVMQVEDNAEGQFLLSPPKTVMGQMELRIKIYQDQDMAEYHQRVVFP